MQFEVWLTTELFVNSEVSRFTVERTLGVPASAVVDFLTDEEFTLEQLVGTSAQLSYTWAGDVEQTLVGVIDWVELTTRGNNLQTNEPTVGYRIHIVSRIGLLDESVDSRIFQNQTVKEIVTKVLADHGIQGPDVDFRCLDQHPTWEYCVQYQESGLNFVSRLLEREGIHYFSECDSSTKGEVLRFRDDSSLADPIESPSTLSVRHRSTLPEDWHGVYGFEPHNRMSVGKIVLRDYDFKQPKQKLLGEASAPHDVAREVHYFPGDFTDVGVGKHFAELRLQAAQVEHEGWSVAAAIPNLTEGRSVTIVDNGQSHELFIHAVVHNYVAHLTQGANGESQPLVFEARAEAIPLKTRFRVPLCHAKPVIHGPQTAVVVAPDGAPEEEIHTDEYARCKVRFHWDRSGISNDQASCWMRVTQLQTSGSMALPRIGWEVIVEFIHGDPDRPVVTGLLYTGNHMPPYALPGGATRTAIRSSSSPGGGGINEIRFEDKAGAEEIMIGSQYNMTIVTANNRNKTVTKDETVVIGSNSTTEIGADEKITIGQGSKIQIGSNQEITVGAARKFEVNAVTGLTVSGNATTSVGALQFEMNGSPLAGLIAAVSAKAAAVAQAKADQAIGAIQGAVQGKIDQVMGPINDLTSKAEGLGNAMKAVGGGNLGATGLLAGGVSGLASAGMGGGGLAAFRAAPGGGDPAGVVASTNAITSKLSDALGGAAAKAKAAVTGAIEGATGDSAAGGGASSMANRGGPAADLAGFSASDTATGPGHAQYTVSGSHSETTATAHVMAVVGGVNLNVSGSMTQNVGAALVELVKGDHAESVEGVKNEKQIGLVVATKGGETETASGSLAYTIGGALIEKVNGTMEMEAGAPATFIGAFHKIDAGTAITLTCGASSVVIDGGGITIKSVMVNFVGGTMAVTKPTNHA
jgi:type VI secretion system secreted protein VgrG